MVSGIVLDLISSQWIGHHQRIDSMMHHQQVWNQRLLYRGKNKKPALSIACIIAYKL